MKLFYFFNDTATTEIYTLFSILLISGLSGCFYMDSDMYLVDPVPGDPPGVSVSTSLDTLYNPPVNDSLRVDYRIEVTGGELYYVYAELGQYTVYESDSSQGSFLIIPDMADSEGIDTLHMRFFYSSNTNSLADKLGYEALVKDLDFALYFNTVGAR
jgi:hypothetical protein